MREAKALAEQSVATAEIQVFNGILTAF